MNLENFSALIIDDSALSRDLIASILIRLRVGNVEKAINGKIGLEKIRTACACRMPYDLITLDWEMPQMSGLEVLRELRKDPLTAEAPVLIITAVATQEAVKAAAIYKPLGYIVKPFNDQVFKEKLSHFFA